jgi:hypothetical protein
MATDAFSSRSVRIWKSNSAPDPLPLQCAAILLGPEELQLQGPLLQGASQGR